MEFTSQKPNAPKRFASVNAAKLRNLRHSLGWSQSVLARRAGYSARLIRKAESGGSLNYETIDDLANALSTHSTPIGVEQLLFNLREIVQQLIEAYDAHGAQLVCHMRQYFAADIQLTCSADRKEVPFAGTWHGVSGISDFFEAFFKTYSRLPQSAQVTYLVGESCVAARFNEVLHYRGHCLPPHRVCWVCEFLKGKIVSIEYEYDQYQASKNLKALSMNKSLKAQ